MGWTEIWAQFVNVLLTAQNAATWKVSVEGVASGPVTVASFSPLEAKYEFTDNGKTITIEAKISSDKDHADVYVNGARQSDARLIFTMKSQPPFKPMILVLEFKHVELSTGLVDIRFDHPK
jgi:hypothetical protein